MSVHHACNPNLPGPSCLEKFRPVQPRVHLHVRFSTVCWTPRGDQGLAVDLPWGEGALEKSALEAQALQQIFGG